MDSHHSYGHNQNQYQQPALADADPDIGVYNTQWSNVQDSSQAQQGLDPAQTSGSSHPQGYAQGSSYQPQGTFEFRYQLPYEARSQQRMNPSYPLLLPANFPSNRLPTDAASNPYHEMGSTNPYQSTSSQRQLNHNLAQNTSQLHRSSQRPHRNLHRSEQRQHGHRGLGITQSDVRRTLNEHEETSQRRETGSNSNPAPSAKNVAATPAFSPSDSRKRRLEVGQFEDIQPLSGGEVVPNAYLDDIVWLCCMWLALYPGKEPNPNVYNLISDICHVSKEDVKSIFENIRNSNMWPDRKSLGPIPSAVFNMWSRNHLNSSPINTLLASMAEVFRGDIDKLHRLSTRSARRPSAIRDSAIGNSMSTRRSSLNVYAEGPQPPQCKRKPRNKLKKKDKTMYMCTHCGAEFQRKGDWKKHESKNYYVERWYCDSDHDIEWFSSKNLYREHINACRRTELIESNHLDLQVKLFRGRHRERCVFRACESRFNDFVTSMEHIAECFETRHGWEIKDLRVEPDDLIEEDNTNETENTRNGRHDEDETRDPPSQASISNVRPSTMTND